MTALMGRQTVSSRLVSLAVDEPKVRPAKVTTHGHFFQCRRRRRFLC